MSDPASSDSGVHKRLYERALAAAQRGDYRRAIAAYNVVLNGGPPRELEISLRLGRSRAFLETAQWAKSESDCRQVLSFGDVPEARWQLAQSLLPQGQTSEVLVHLRKMPEDSRPSNWWVLCAKAHSDQGEHESANLAALEARNRIPGIGSLSLLLQVLASAGRHEELTALASQEEAQLLARPDLCAKWGASLNALGASREAIRVYRLALAIEPKRCDANCGLALALLRVGEYTEGWRRNEYRQKDAGECSRLGVRSWRGESLQGKHLIVKCEQGFGDCIQFARFLPLAAREAEKVTFLVPPIWSRLFQHGAQLAEIRTHVGGFGEGDCQTLVMSLPHLLRLGGGIEKAEIPYLFAEADLKVRWEEALPNSRRIALNWQGNPNYAGEPWRSMPFEFFGPILDQFEGEAAFISVQKNFGSEQLSFSPLSEKVLDLSSQLDLGGDSFVDTLAVLSSVDLFITTDTGLAHLAGAAGVRTWLLLSAVADWRWGIGADTTPWYSSMKILRQSQGDDWRNVIDRVATELKQEFFATDHDTSQLPERDKQRQSRMLGA